MTFDILPLGISILECSFCAGLPSEVLQESQICNTQMLSLLNVLSEFRCVEV